MLDEVLNAWHVTHALAADGKEALLILQKAAAEGAPFTIALIDMQMPGMDGKQLGNLIQEDKKLANAHLVLFTSQGQRGDARKIHATGFAGYLNKPINQSDLPRTTTGSRYQRTVQTTYHSSYRSRNTQV